MIIPGRRHFHGWNRLGTSVSRFFATISYLLDNVEFNPACIFREPAPPGQYGLAVASPGSNTANVNARRVLAPQPGERV